MKLWIGEEKEGEYKGRKTLFIGTCKIGLRTIKSILKRHKDITQLYFGAGGCTNINQETVWKCVNNLSYMLITLEVRMSALELIDEDLFKHVSFILTINDRNLSKILKMNKNDVQIKLQSLETDDKLLIIQNYNKFDSVDISKLNGKTYEGDIVLK